MASLSKHQREALALLAERGATSRLSAVAAASEKVLNSQSVGALVRKGLAQRGTVGPATVYWLTADGIAEHARRQAKVAVD